MAMILANKNQTRSNKKNINVLHCLLSRKKREKTNYKKIPNWSKLMSSTPTLFKDAKKIIVDKKCGNIYEILGSIAIGASLGALYYFLLNLSNNSNLVYFSDTISNNVQCTRPTNQNFKCKVYKGGNAITDS